ncbi:hypothetical protein [Kitasatospora phosalacinea]|uniref:D-alanyl-D-alanine dipeptidase n=1 Tax=Kitasatospora phosalacinea TaxID=2065 RepID=A0ABW6GFV5_9ACTN
MAVPFPEQQRPRRWPGQQPEHRHRHRHWHRRWPAWAPAAAAGWGVLYAAVQTGWALTGTTVPWKAHSAYPPAAQFVLAALALAAGAAAYAARAPRRPGPAARAAVAAASAVFAVGATGLPIHFVALVTLSGAESATGLAQVLLNAVGAALLLLVLLSSRRRSHGRCPRCGREHPGAFDGPLVHPAASTAARRTRLAAYLLACGLLPWAGAKTVWTLGGSALGVTAAEWDRAVTPGESGAAATAAAGIDVTVLAAAVALFLLLGLLHPWGQVFPRWTLPLAGRRVPRLLPLLPAWLTGVPLAVYGAVLNVLAVLLATGVLAPAEPGPPFTAARQVNWMVEFGGLAFAGLGSALVLAARSYGARTRPVCAAADRADPAGVPGASLPAAEGDG